MTLIMKQNKSYHAPAVDRAIDVIELMANSEMDMSLSQIIAMLNIPRQSLIRILNTLCDRGIVDRTQQRGFYLLGMKLLYIGNRLQDKINLRVVAWPFMQELSRKTSKTIELSILDRDQLICIERIQGNEGVNLYSRVGSVYPYFHAVSVGKIYLAHMDPTKRSKILEKIGLPAVTEHTITDAGILDKELLKVMEDGFAFEDQELRQGVRRIAAPIYDHRNDLAGCISIAAPIFSFMLDGRQQLGWMAIEAAQKISDGMGQTRDNNRH